MYKKNNRQIIRNLLLGCSFSFVTLNVISQEVQPFSVQNDDSLTVKLRVIPGNLFSATSITNTGAVSSITDEILYKTPTSSITNTVSGRLAGLYTVGGNGLPRYDGGSWYIRGIGTYALSGNANISKYFVDGFEVNSDYLSYLTPAEIGSISILKDAAALSTFGMRGANGVVWIETKRGEIGAPKVQLQTRTGIQKAINLHKPLNSYDFANLYNQAISNDNGMVWTPTYSGAQLDNYKNGTATDVDWYDEVLKDKGYYTDADLTFFGGSDIVRYNVVLGYANQQGLFDVENSDETSNIRFSKYNMRTNFDIKLFKILQASIDVGGRLQDWNRPNYDASTLMNNLARYPSNIYPVYDEDTDDDPNFSGTSIYPNNPVASIRGLGWQHSRWRILQANFKFKEDLDFIVDGLYLQQAFSFFVQSRTNYSKTKNYARYRNGAYQTTDRNTTIVASSLGSGGMEEWKQGTLTIGYGNGFGDHVINSALNMHISAFNGEGLFGYRYHYLNYNGKVNYVFDNRYVAELGFSYFGSDAFAPGNKFGFYPAISASWVVSNESFLESSDMVKFLKVRASVGATGGAESYEAGMTNFLSDGRYLYQQYLASSQAGNFYTGNSAPFDSRGTLAPLFLANENVFAEKSLKYNTGIDLNLFHKVDFTLDLFLDKRSGILTWDNSIMRYYGRNMTQSNIGEMTNRGFEASIAYTDRVGDFNWSLFGMAFHARNTIDYWAEVTPAYPYNATTGRSYGSRLGLESIGFFELDDFNVDGSLKTGIPEPMFGTVQPGDIRYRDRNEDGYIDQTDVDEIGNPPYPRWAFSFGGSVVYKGFDFSLFFYGSASSTVNLLNYPTQTAAFVNNGNAYEWAKGAWAYYPDQGINNTGSSATYPRLTTLENENNYRNSTFWIRNNDFLRLKNIELGYDLGKTLSQFGISKLRLYVNALNPVTFSKLLKDYNMDPESGYGYPALKSYNAGIQITF